jgi:serine/threonine-protein kinase HipA
MTERLVVMLYGRPIGTLEREGSAERPSFRYDASYVEAGEVALSARLPISAAPYPARKVEPFLQGLLPENRATRDLWARRLGTSSDDTFGMLSQMGWDCPGAVQFCEPSMLDQLESRQADYQPVSSSDIARRLRDLLDQPSSWTMPDEHWSLAGQQEKFALAWVAGGWHAAHGSAATTHIVKPGIKALHHQALVEHATMSAAVDLGLDIAHTELERFDDQWAVVIERFDRVEDAGRILRIHQEDFCQALGRLPEAKYEARGGPGLEAMVRTVKQQSTAPEDDLLALADFLIVNVAAAAPDGHAKNISMLRAPGERWVAPLYDLATGLSYDKADVERTVALSVGGERSFARIRRKQWARAAGALGIDADRVCTRAAALATAYPDAFEAALVRLGTAPGAEEVASRTLPGLRKHCDRILSQLDH